MSSRLGRPTGPPCLAAASPASALKPRLLPPPTPSYDAADGGGERLQIHVGSYSSLDT